MVNSETVRRVTLDIANPEGANSAYVLPDSRTVVDPGPPTDEAWSRLCSGIEAAGLALDDVEFVFVTHWHADHAGLAPRLAETADARVVMHETDAPLVADYARERERRVERDARRLSEWGVPSSVVEALQSGDRPSPIPDSLAVETLEDGESLTGVTAVHTPGHTLGHAAFVCKEVDADEAENLFVGDLVLPTYTPNVGGGDTRLEDALATYLESLEQVRDVTRDVGAKTVAPGHGAPLTLDERINEIVAHHDERSRRTVTALATCLEENGELDAETTSATATPWDVATRLFGELSGIHAKMGAGEAASHLDFLRKRGAVEEVGEEDVRRYRVVDAERAGIEAKG
jgi:glyoxylase-like metal-dependent hydrolase (beta-lactamase superfamily II)